MKYFEYTISTSEYTDRSLQKKGRDFSNLRLFASDINTLVKELV